MDDGESTGRETERGRGIAKEREREFASSLSTEEDQRFVLCISMDIQSPILMSQGM